MALPKLFTLILSLATCVCAVIAAIYWYLFKHGRNHSSRSAKGNRYLRRILNQAAHAAVKKQDSHFHLRRLLPMLGYKAAIWAVAHRLCRLVWKILHDQVGYIEQGSEPTAKAKQPRARALLRRLRKLGYQVTIENLNPTQAKS